ncbi:MAG: Blue-light-activated protein [Syntrophus sp. PtaB.Bin001]|nr:MAG: Blue-light-activated protein [Syntrophus sp. PtaB.Bin001]
MNTNKINAGFAKELEAEGKFRGIFENAIEGIFRTTPGGGFLDANPALARMYGYESPEELIRSVSNVKQLYVEPETRDSWLSVIEQQNQADFEAEMHKKDGGTFWIFQSVRAIRNSTGKTIYYEGFSEDITKYKRAEEALRQSETLYRTIFENTGTSIIVLEEDTTISLANTEFEKLSGYRKEDIEGKKSWTEFIFPDDLERMLTQHRLRRTDAKATRRKYEFRFVDRYGSIKNIALRVDMIPGTKKSIASLLNITERKRAEEALISKNQQLLDIINFLPDATLVIDREGRVIAWNKAIEAMTGIKAEDMLGKGEYEYALPFYGERRPILIDLALHPDRMMEKHYTAIQQVGDILFGESFTPALPPGDVHLSATASVLRDSRGEVFAAIECIRDNSEWKRLQERLNRAEKMEGLGRLAGGVAHDLNNVLGILVGYSEMLAEQVPEDSFLKKYAQNIQKAGVRGAAIVQDLLTMARRGVTVSKVVDLNQVITDYLKTPEFEDLQINYPLVKISTDFEEGLLNIKGSPVHLGKTVMNLVSNAAEAVSGSGKVTIRTANRYLDKPIRGYDAMQEGDYAVLMVSDTGSGISAEDIDKIFEPFYTKKVMGRSGTGLGLAVVWGTVKDHKGYIDVHSEEGKGTTFTLYFPVTREEKAEDRKAAPPESYLGRGETILVVDDSSEQRDLALTMLKGLGYRANAASGGEEAIAYLQSNRADLLVLDMIMDPGIDGLETFQRILKICPAQKAVIVSGFSQTERVKKAQELGAGVYVRKPYILERLGLAVRKELDR